MGYSLAPEDRKFYGLTGAASEPGFQHMEFNALQFGAYRNPRVKGRERIATGMGMFEFMSISNPANATIGTYAGLKDLGVNATTGSAWRESYVNLLQILENHFHPHDFLLGGRP